MTQSLLEQLEEIYIERGRTGVLVHLHREQVIKKQINKALKFQENYADPDMVMIKLEYLRHLEGTIKKPKDLGRAKA